MADIRQTIVIEASLTKIQSDLRTLEGNFKSSFARIQSGANAALGALGIGIGVGALLAFSKQVVDLGDKLSDLSDQTGLSIEVLGGIRVIAEQSGSSLEAFAKGINLAQKELGGLDEAGKKLLENLGTSQQELINSSPDQFLEKLAKALATVENQYERNAIGAKLLGKSYAELAPTINEIAEHGLPRLAQETAEAYKHLGQLKDQTDALKAKLFDLGATALVTAAQLTGLIPLDEIQSVGKMAERVDFLTGRFARLKGISKGAIDAQTIDQLKALERSIPEQGIVGQFINPSGKKTLQDLIAAREEQEKLLAAANRPKPTQKPGEFKGLIQSTATVAKDTGVENFFDNLQKQIEQIDLEFTKLRDGDKIAKEIALDLQFADFNQRRVAEGKPIASINEFRKYKEVILGANDALEKLKANKELVELTQTLSIKAIDTSTPQGKETARIASIEVDFIKTAKKIEELGKAAELTQEEIAGKVALAWKGALLDITETAQEQFKALDANFQNLEKTLSIEILPEDQQGAARARQDFEDRIKTIREWRDAAIAAGQDVQTVNAEAAQATANAWAVASEKMKGEADELTKFQERAFEKIQDFLAGGINDVLSGNIKSKDWGLSIKKTIDGIVSESLALQLKTALFGEKLGAKTGGTEIGGLIGDLLGNKKPEAKQLPGITPADVLDQERGREIAAAASQTQGPAIAETTIQTQTLQAVSVEATTAIEASSTAATAGLEVSSAAAETAITTLGATTEASIAALQATAIAAIEAASATQAINSGGAASSIPLIGSLFSSGAPAADAGAQGIGGGLLALGYHRGGAIGHSPSFTRAVDALDLPRLHTGGAISPAIDAVQLSKVAESAFPRFHDGGQMWSGAGDLKPGERMIIAEDGEFVLNKRAVMKAGMKKLEQLNRLEAMVIPAKFHQGGAVLRTDRLTMIDHSVALKIPHRHDGGLVDQNIINSDWSSRVTAPSYSDMTAATIPQTMYTLVAGGTKTGNGGPSTNIANFINPQFQNRQSVGQTSAQLTAAMEAGKRNR